MNFQEYLKDAAEQFGVVLTEKMLRQFDLYFQLLVEWNEKINLTAITEPREVAIKHMIDSLSCWDDRYFPPGADSIRLYSRHVEGRFWLISGFTSTSATSLG